jgi:hypothetical protein
VGVHDTHPAVGIDATIREYGIFKRMTGSLARMRDMLDIVYTLIRHPENTRVPARQLALNQISNWIKY